MHVLGIDAGGTKTLCLLADERGRILGQAIGPGANLQAAGARGVEDVLRRVIEGAVGASGDPEAICVGIAGVDREEDLRTARSLVHRICGGARVLVVNDALIALVAGVRDAAGIVVIAGTGSIVYGRNAADATARAGGWGHLIGDEGSGYWIGREALAAIVREADGRGPATSLTRAVLAHFGLPEAAGLVRLVYDRVLPRMNVAAVAPVVERAAAAGDAVAAHILSRAADELVAAAGSVAERLAMRGDAFPFVLAGGVFEIAPSLADALARRLPEVAPRAHVRRLDVEPATGAVWLALAGADGASRAGRGAG